jgi:glycosyltransferase involved in cell wall biosynthesis
MKIGIDTTALPDQPVGAGKYILQLVRWLAYLPTEHRWVIFATRRGRSQIGDLASQNVEWIVVPNYPPSFRLIWEQARLPFLVRRSGIDLLHSPHYTRPYFLPCASVVTYHDMTFFLFPQLHTLIKRLYFPWAIRMSAKRADAWIANSESTRGDSIRILNLPPGRIYTTPLGVLDAFHPIDDPAILEPCREKYHLPPEFILFVGLIEPRKNLSMLLKAYAPLVKSSNPLPLILVGRLGWGYQRVLQLVKQLKLENWVQFAGYLPDQDLPIVYNLAQIFVYPSSYEGFGFPPLEAMACGTPVITTAISALEENVGEAGLLVSPQDELALTEALQTLIQNPTLQERLSQAGIKRAARFSWEHTARLTLKIYETLG